MSENDIINRYLKQAPHHTTCRLSIGDDAAITQIPEGYVHVTSIDTSVENIHFSKNTAPEHIGYKSLAVSISDIAAMGAKPTTALLSLCLPHKNDAWLDAFSSGFFSLINHFDMGLIGGDITQGSTLVISTVVNGIAPMHTVLCRHTARVGDHIYVTGQLGQAAMALQHHNHPDCAAALNTPTPRIQAGIALREIASAAIDISDGLAADLTAICEASGVGATVWVDQIPRIHADWHTALTGGDDYELCFTASPDALGALHSLKLDCKITCVGTITAHGPVRFIHDTGQPATLTRKGYEHF